MIFCQRKYDKLTKNKGHRPCRRSIAQRCAVHSIPFTTSKRLLHIWTIFYYMTSPYIYCADPTTFHIHFVSSHPSCAMVLQHCTWSCGCCFHWQANTELINNFIRLTFRHPHFPQRRQFESMACTRTVVRIVVQLVSGLFSFIFHIIRRQIYCGSPSSYRIRFVFLAFISHNRFGTFRALFRLLLENFTFFLSLSQYAGQVDSFCNLGDSRDKMLSRGLEERVEEWVELALDQSYRD